MMRKTLVVSILIVTLFLGLPNHAIAAETPNNNTVYVAGNPDLFPFEYYDMHSESYQGILPELYRQISQTTGLEFVYIRPGMLNRQRQLAKNSQVELVSAYVRGEIKPGGRELILLQYDEHREICIAFTSVMPKSIENQIRSSLENLSAQHILQLALQVPEPQPEQKLYWMTGITIGIMLLIISVLAVIVLRQCKDKKKSRESQFLDPLTGIGNITYFENTYRHCITPANYALYYLSYISLNIQRIEQYLGIVKAEEIQRYAADVLSQTASDEDFTARIGNGVFILAFQSPSGEDANTRISEILHQLNSYEGTFLEEHRITFRAGIFWIDSANLSVETAVFNARQGYNAAEQNHCSCIFVDKALLNRETAKIKLQQRLSNALTDNEFLLYMQMIVDRNEQIIGAEALTRWQSREKGLLTPAAFIEPLKAGGLIDKLDFYILEEACKQLEQWHLTERGHLWISCNFTRLTLSRNDFLERFREVIGRYQFSLSCLIIELTEDSLMDNSTVAYNNILECKKLGCQIALDDLGSGYSSLQDLCDYPIDILKIDRHILLKSTTPRGNSLLQGLTKLGHDLGMKVLCEGVESESEKRRICEAGCDYLQGFYYSHVLPKDEADLFYLRSLHNG